MPVGCTFTEKELKTVDLTIFVSKTFKVGTIFLFSHVRETFGDIQVWEHGKKFSKNNDSQKCDLVIHSHYIGPNAHDFTVVEDEKA